LLGETGAVAAELALLMPVIATLIFGTIYFGIALTNYQQLTFGVASGARAFAVARGSTTPYTSAVAAVTTGASNLTANSIGLVFSVNGTTCASDAACITALATGAGLSSTIAGTYPCSLVVPFATTVTNCTLKATTSQLIE